MGVFVKKFGFLLLIIAIFTTTFAANAMKWKGRRASCNVIDCRSGTCYPSPRPECNKEGSDAYIATIDL